MNSEYKISEDHLKHFMNPGKSESAPDGFTSSVMENIRLLEIRPHTVVKPPKRNSIPYISIAVTLLFIIITVLVPDKDLYLSSLIPDMKISLPNIDLSWLYSLKIPPVIVYAMSGVLVLTIFDLALYLIFDNKRNLSGR